MTLALDQMRERDARIDALEALGDARSYADTVELSRLHKLRDVHWRRIPAQLADVRRRAAELEIYAHRHRLPVEQAA